MLINLLGLGRKIRIIKNFFVLISLISIFINGTFFFKLLLFIFISIRNRLFTLNVKFLLIIFIRKTIFRILTNKRFLWVGIINILFLKFANIFWLKSQRIFIFILINFVGIYIRWQFLYFLGIHLVSTNNIFIGFKFLGRNFVQFYILI